MQLDRLVFKPSLLRGQRVLVTGGGTGLGRVMAEACLSLGAEVYVCGRRGEVAQEAAREMMEAHGGKAVGLACDIRQPEAIAALLDAIWADGGPLTSLVNNAAGNFVARTEDISVRGFDAISNIVFRGTFQVTQQCGKRWLAQGCPGTVVSIVTSWVWNGCAFAVPSAMSKAGVATMTQSLAVEWGGRGIRLNAIAPGLFPTEGMLARLDPNGNTYDPAGTNPMKRAGQMHELANLAVFLLGPGSEFLNGQTIAIDGAQYQASGGNFAHLAGWTDADWQQAQAAIPRRGGPQATAA
ncbi:SDR family oxidoreductase [Ramlibacter sp. G-1-2-2]|uniref:SDR family oxidoreductase n=1 Tax=Ramlibacter agri TaxID=2728837 RepID=A0A848HCQ3_9BURK|nr:SDR family oxidoreductase [Ramlibacter agri]NML47250.1 SDR family oxidoreductase [Ramlibacter agri]